MRRVAVAVLVAALGCGWWFGSSAGAESPSEEIKVKAARRPDGRYKAAIQAVLGPGAKKNFYVKVRSRGEPQEDASLSQASLIPSGWKIRWFRGRTEITEPVQGFGYEFFLAGGEAKRFRVKVKRAELSNAGGCVLASGRDDSGGIAVAAIAINLSASSC